MTDDRCAEQDPERIAIRYDVPRALRLVLADVRDDDDAEAQIKAEVGDCAACWRGIASVLAGTVHGLALSRAEDNTDLVEEQILKQLAAVLYEPDER
ncbi:hypothetical protein [Mycolicibacterium wolinskyi]|uniref:hypothetical protein n=1 Tax=Mycolicibacterium wolinskyi TaxID=59750 RepID=UPI00391782BB